MKKLFITLLGFGVCLFFFGQQTFGQDRNWTVFIQTECNNKLLGSLLQNAVAMEITKELPCLRVTTQLEFQEKMAEDRAKSLSGGEDKNNIAKIIELTDADYKVSLSVFEAKDSYQVSGGASSRRGSNMARNEYSADKANPSADFHEIGKAIAMEFVEKQLCPFVGKLTMTTERTSDEIHETESRCGKDNSGYFKGTIKRELVYSENLTLEKKGRLKAKGTMYVTGYDMKMNHEINSGCVNCWTYEGDDVTGIDMTNFTSSDYKVVIMEHYKVDGLALLTGASEANKEFSAQVIIDFDKKDGTYMLTLVAVSNKGTCIKSKEVTNITSCKKDPEPDEEKTFGYIISVKNTWGPFKGKITDKTLEDSKTETDNNKIDGGEETYTGKVNFSFTR
jgi:hypothetical protein